MANFVPLTTIKRIFGFGKYFQSYARDASIIRNYSKDSFPTQSRVVICGGGTVGTSVAYHLTLKGITDVVLLEQGSLSCGTSWHGAGVFRRVRPASKGLIADYGASLLADLEKQGHHTGLVNNGSITLCKDLETTKNFMYQIEKLRNNGIELSWISQEKIAELSPFVKIENYEGGFWTPGDCVANPTDICQTFSKLAKEKGARIIEDCRVDSVETKDGRISAVKTSLGKISCEYFILCGGMWSHHFGLKMNPPVDIPAHASQHFYLVTKPIEGVTTMMPSLIDFHNHTYIRQWSGGLLCGLFEPNAIPEFGGGVPSDLRYHLFESNWDHFEKYLDNIIHIAPVVKHAKVQQLLNGPESFSPDGAIILGEPPQIMNMFVATAMCSGGVLNASGAGRVISELVNNEEPFVDCSQLDIKRFQKHMNNANFLYDRTTEILGYIFGLVVPMQKTVETSRKARTSSLFPLQEQQGAIFHPINGIETPVYYNPSQQELPPASITKPNWLNLVKEEYIGLADHCGIVDLTHTHSYFKIFSSRARNVLDQICKEEIPSKPGQVVHTWLLNSKAKYVLDIHILCESENSFIAIVPLSKQNYFIHWLRKHEHISDGTLDLVDLTSGFTTIGLVGNKASMVFEELSKTDVLANEYKSVHIGYGDGVLAFRPAYFPKDGVLLSVPSPHVYTVYDAIKQHQIQPKDIGLWTYETLRIVQNIPNVDNELTASSTPQQVHGNCGTLKERTFLGKEALRECNQSQTRLASIEIQDIDSNSGDWFWGGEIINNGSKKIGTVTSITFDFNKNRFVGMGLIDFAVKDNTSKSYITLGGKDFLITIK